MQVYENLDISLSQTAIAIGNFDGCHFGHQQLFKRVVELSKDRKLVSTVLTFSPHPADFLRHRSSNRLTTLSEKLTLLDQFGISTVWIFPFDGTTSQWTSHEFFESICARVDPKVIVVGEDFRFGKDRTGNIEFLKKLCQKQGIQLEVISDFQVKGHKVSSSLIRELLGQGLVEETIGLLGRKYSVEGKVLKGEGRGRLLGFPTANVSFSKEKIPLKLGVYKVTASWQRDTVDAVANFGMRPTFQDTLEPILEVHLLGLEKDLYGETLKIEFEKFVRPEKRFSSKEDLKEQIKADIEWIQKNNPQLRLAK